ncbi:DUF1178 family protein [Pseudogemmobacter sp. W21_MBD1_M6]|uniref:DUF1178 family protein n=1 Tax=Pseudogemmobacter sp. W21_MBD1_M6 TaxID=3240271 RepID=UPI003F9A09F6
MIRYALKCSNDHGFDSWFKSADAFDKLCLAGMVACPECNSTKVQKAIMAPRVVAPRPQESAPPPRLNAPLNEMEKALAALKAKVEATSEYVGTDFATEARAIHDGTAPERAIYGEAKPAEARALIEDGVPVAALPFMLSRKTN